MAGCYPDCPGKEDVAISYSVNSDIEEVGGSILFDGEVTVLEVTSRASQWDVQVSGLDLDGIERDIHLAIDATPGITIPFETGETIRLQYVHDEPLWENSFMGFWKDGDLVLALFDQAIIVQGDLWIDRIRLDVKRGYCAKKSDECGARERAGIRFTGPDGHSTLVMDHGTGMLLGDPSYRILVAQARINYDTLFVPCPNRERGRLVAVLTSIAE